jgi:hypothetical protein
MVTVCAIRRRSQGFVSSAVAARGGFVLVRRSIAVVEEMRRVKMRFDMGDSLPDERSASVAIWDVLFIGLIMIGSNCETTGRGSMRRKE